MNYIFFNIGKTPNYLNYSINSVLSLEKDARVIFCSDKETSIKGIESLNTDYLEGFSEKQEQILKIFSKLNFDQNPLWYSSILRVYALNFVSKHLNLKSFTHFDNDVLLYKNIEELKQKNCFNNKSINITKSDNNHLVFGFSYFPNIELIENLCEFFDEILQNYRYYSNNYSRGKNLSEMRMLQIAESLNPNLFNILESLPYDNNEILFDPSSYGQYFDGTHIKRGNYYFKRRYVSTNHLVGREIKSSRIEPIFKNKTPYVKFENKNYQLANLHIHSKNLNKFLNNKYKTIISL